MNKILWNGKLSWWLKLLLNINSVVAWLIGRLRDPNELKSSVAKGYDGVYTDHVSDYDHFGVKHYKNITELLLNPLDLQGAIILDVGCGTGITSMYANDQGASKVFAMDFSARMLRGFQDKLNGNSVDVIKLVQADAESLPFNDNTFDIVCSSMVLGFLPNPAKAISEFQRVLRKNGYIAIAAHGTKHYWEAVDAAFWIVSKKYTLGKRLEFWPIRVGDMQRLLVSHGLVDTKINNQVWEETFVRGKDAFDFFAATTAAWWASKIPDVARQKQILRMRHYFDEKKITKITSDIILAYAKKQ